MEWPDWPRQNKIGALPKKMTDKRMRGK